MSSNSSSTMWYFLKYHNQNILILGNFIFIIYYLKLIFINIIWDFSEYTYSLYKSD